MSAIDDLPPLREVVARHGLDARKTLGQNFLFDLNLTARIARAAGASPQTTCTWRASSNAALSRSACAVSVMHFSSSMASRNLRGVVLA